MFPSFFFVGFDIYNDSQLYTNRVKGSKVETSCVGVSRTAFRKNSKQRGRDNTQDRVPIPAPTRIHNWPPSHSTTVIQSSFSSLTIFFLLACLGRSLVPLARDHPQGHGVGPSRRCSDKVSLLVGAVEVLCIHRHLHHQTVVETDDPQKRLLLVHSVSDKKLHGGEWIA